MQRCLSFVIFINLIWGLFKNFNSVLLFNIFQFHEEMCSFCPSNIKMTPFQLLFFLNLILLRKKNCVMKSVSRIVSHREFSESFHPYCFFVYYIVGKHVANHLVYLFRGASYRNYTLRL